MTPKKTAGSRVAKTPRSAKGKGKVKKEADTVLLHDEDEDELVKAGIKAEDREMEKTPEKEDLGDDDIDPANFPFFQQ